MTDTNPSACYGRCRSRDGSLHVTALELATQEAEPASGHRPARPASWSYQPTLVSNDNDRVATEGGAVLGAGHAVDVRVAGAWVAIGGVDGGMLIASMISLAGQ